jgi:hypothetical protein
MIGNNISTTLPPTLIADRLRQLRPSSWLRGTPSPSMTVPILPSFRRPIQAPPSILSWTFHHTSSHKGMLFFKPNWPALPLWRMPAVGPSLTNMPMTPLLWPSLNTLPCLGGAIPLLLAFPLPWQMPLLAFALPFLLFKTLVALAILPPQLPPGIRTPLALMPSFYLPMLRSPLLGDILTLTWTTTVLHTGVLHTPSPLGGCLTTPLLPLIVGGLDVQFHSMGGYPLPCPTLRSTWGGHFYFIGSSRSIGWHAFLHLWRCSCPWGPQPWGVSPCAFIGGVFLWCFKFAAVSFAASGCQVFVGF